MDQEEQEQGKRLVLDRRTLQQVKLAALAQANRLATARGTRGPTPEEVLWARLAIDADCLDAVAARQEAEHGNEDWS